MCSDFHSAEALRLDETLSCDKPRLARCWLTKVNTWAAKSVRLVPQVGSAVQLLPVGGGGGGAGGGGGGAVVTVTVADFVAVPPAPVQVRLKVLVAVSAAVISLPEVGLVPLQAPDAEQEDVPLLVQESALLLPAATDVGWAERFKLTGIGAPPVEKVRAILSMIGDKDKFEVRRVAFT
jgi:hypothetical protein